MQDDFDRSVATVAFEKIVERTQTNCIVSDLKPRASSWVIHQKMSGRWCSLKFFLYGSLFICSTTQLVCPNYTSFRAIQGNILDHLP